MNADVKGTGAMRTAEHTADSKYLTFALDASSYGIEIGYVTEIIGMQSFTDLPETPPYIIGVINLRGKVIPLVDVRARFGFERIAYDDRTCIIVVNIKRMAVGLVVDTVLEVLDIAPGNIEPAPEVRPEQGNRFVMGLGKVGETVKILLDMEKLLFENEVRNVGSLSGSD